LKYKIVTLGCKVNAFDSDTIKAALDNSGCKQADKEDKPDVYIINTCTVTSRAGMQSRQEIRKAVRLKEKNKNLKIIATGCYAQTEPYEIEKIKGVDIIIGNTDKHSIPNLIVKSEIFSDILIPTKSDRTREFLKIQDGCSAFCSYCIVPYARGASKSMEFETVIKSLKRLKENFFNEVVLTGIHLGCYGLDLTPKTSLYNLLKYISEKRPIHRIRISSVEPKEFYYEMIELISKSDVICDHFHIPLQSGDDEILKKMNRPYNSNYFEDLINSIKKLMPNAAIGVDVIAGFPQESENAFKNTYSLIEKLPISYLHVFPFSPRKNTPAEKFSGKVPSIEIKKRATKLRKLGVLKRALFYESQKGRTIEAVIESESKIKKGLFQARTSNYIPVLVKADAHMKGEIVNVRIEHIEKHTVFGKITNYIGENH
jgi:threonylcarbamoyladenosine tRNA methylthiotransferase MtaB